MRFLKNEIINMKEVVCDASNIFDVLSDVSHGGYIYYVSPEQYERLQNMSISERSKALMDYNSEYAQKRIGCFNKSLVGSPLVLTDKEDSYSTRSFVFIFKNPIKQIDSNDCEVVENYPSINTTRDIAKYTTDYGLYTDTSFEEMTKMLIEHSEKFYKVNNVYNGGFLFHTTPKEAEKNDKTKNFISKGAIGKRRIEITREQALEMIAPIPVNDLERSF